MDVALSASLPLPSLLTAPPPFSSCPLGQHCGGAQSLFY